MKEEYQSLCKEAKTTFKKKWASMELCSENGRTISSKSTANSQLQQSGRKGTWKTRYQLETDEGPVVAQRIMRHCSDKGKGWSKFDVVRGEQVFLIGTEFASDTNRKEFSVFEAQDS
eukprot:5777292-Amphidinium_carterae.1